MSRREQIHFLAVGDSVGIASRMESHGLPGRVQVTEPLAREVAGQWEFEDRGLIEVKGQEPMRTFLLKHLIHVKRGVPKKLR